MGSRERRTVFVTVGTTCFDALVKAVDSDEVKEALLQKGYTDLLIQMGRGTYMPSKVREAYFETLRLGKPLIVVVNEDLMDNHQSELAEELADRKHLLCARPQTLQETVRAMDLNNFQPYMPGDANQVVTLINRFLGFPVD
ncbi:hypothetical protein SETIT_7G045900v2 [Setaria italica]|uniref:Glycosyl transferase family 28 C-terminal domain-containing protein n=1 Tax=Setaria italica TaxID=4555 RepID=A0A368RSB2_SETIT|nr:hypothetical protein SETIT_7G045900v2 [Setaria italica]